MQAQQNPITWPRSLLINKQAGPHTHGGLFPGTQSPDEGDLLASLFLISSGELDKPGRHLGLCPGAHKELSSSRGGYQGTPRSLSHCGVCDVFHIDAEIWNVVPPTPPPPHCQHFTDFHLGISLICQEKETSKHKHTYSFKIRKSTERQVSFCLFSFYICKA